MRVVWVAALAALVCMPVPAQDIREVLQRSQAMRLAALTPAAADSPQVARLRASFDDLAARYGGGHDLELFVVHGPVLAECLFGRTIVVNASLAEQPEGVRLFILAHEIAHAVLGHWQKLGDLYQRHVPGAVVPATTDPVAAALGREASRLSHRHEFEADAFAYAAIRELGYDMDTVLAVLRLQGARPDTATHPGTRKRLAHLHSLP